ncbi:hypothetical protein GCM10023219_05760 [Stakelama sediminis]|uniref:Diguanylate cyclase (GGDEF)-like protein n=1 Tax=Stakelama sediminis TaxID=463200 RepID=A0A840YUI9_9SPHN|nr:EAL domain-containing protein [Stakelama sediminis]MBB5717293.1 diguanylate cyclase (GGDEF)-like protein [Stakelama sediminis]
MERFSLTGRAVVFALCAGAVAFILALFATAHGDWTADHAIHALIPAIVCAALCWASAERVLSATASALDAAILRLAEAAQGDLQRPIPQSVQEQVPLLADAMRKLFRQLHSNMEDIERLALFDPVTGLSNRVHLRRRCERVLSRMGDDDIAALFFIDLDRFKQVNDTLGHAVGDALLAMVADRLRSVATRAGGDGEAIIGRLSGDEFMMFLSQVSWQEQPDEAARAILAALSEPFLISGQNISIGASIGIAMSPDHGRTLSDLMRAADAAMYEAKSTGGGQVASFSQAMADEVERRSAVERDLRMAVAHRQFALVFQPQVNARTGDIVAAEALLRWRHPRGLRMPSGFLQRAEETGLIVDIGNWVIADVADTLHRWAEQGVEQRLAINISRRQLAHAPFFHSLRESLLDAGAPVSMLELEFTETVLMQCGPEALRAIGWLREDGARIAIDNFGTGYSNLSRLRSMPIDRIKMHSSLTMHVATNADARAITQAVIGLIHGMGCEAIAEGVETDAQTEVLRVIGCDTLQGYAIARPMAEEAFLNWSQREGRISA